MSFFTLLVVKEDFTSCIHTYSHVHVNILIFNFSLITTYKISLLFTGNRKLVLHTESSISYYIGSKVRNHINSTDSLLDTVIGDHQLITLFDPRFDSQY